MKQWHSSELTSMMLSPDVSEQKAGNTLELDSEYKRICCDVMHPCRLHHR